MKKLDVYLQEIKRQKISVDDLQHAAEILAATPQLPAELENPDLTREKREDLVRSLFPLAVRGIIEVLAQDQTMKMMPDLIKEAETFEKPDKYLRCVLEYVKEPDEKQAAGIRKFLSEKYPGRELRIVKEEKPELGSGFILRVGSEEYDWSTEGRKRALADKLKNLVKEPDSGDFLTQKGIIGILKGNLDGIDISAREIGTVSRVGDGIAYVDGIDHAMYGEIVAFDGDVRGMVQDIRSKEIGCILFGHANTIGEGSRAMRTGKMAGIPVGEGFLGRVVDALGNPIDNKGEIEAAGYRPVESPAPGIIERQSVDTPMETGILSIDSMFPIGRGQRELIIGDRQTGKTSIAVDTMLNQKGKDVICIYVAIGQKASTVSRLVHTLEKHGAMEYSIVLAATASDPASLQYIAPYAGTALAEYFMHQGKDVLIVYDDLSKHAVAYRALSLLMERSPGREAYPGDVFYLHSRLLERSARLSDELGGGSITALPIVETQAGDVSAYIPTNVISITDGQIFLESSLFFEGMRPAVNVGLSVSRVGGAAQTKAMKKAAGSVRIDLAQYREMEVFTQFSSDLDPATKAQLTYGSGLMELLKQPLEHPLSMEEQVVILYAATSHLLVDIPKEKLKTFQGGLYEYMRSSYPQVGLKRYFADGAEGDYFFLMDEAHNLVSRAREMYSASIIKEEVLLTKKVLGHRAPALGRQLTRLNKALLEMKRECGGYQVITDAGHLVPVLNSVFGEMEKYLEKPGEEDGRDTILDFYFSVRHFLNMYERVDEHYRFTRNFCHPANLSSGFIVSIRLKIWHSACRRERRRFFSRQHFCRSGITGCFCQIRRRTIQSTCRPRFHRSSVFCWRRRM